MTGQQIDERGPSATYDYLYDGNGSVVGLTDSTGHLVNQYAYDPYGNKTTNTGTAANYFGFQDGYQTVPGLYHYGARYLNSGDARWTQQDSLQHISSLTQNDRYSYAGDDAINLADPSGKDVGTTAKSIACALVFSCGFTGSGSEETFGTPQGLYPTPIIQLERDVGGDVEAIAKAVEPDLAPLEDLVP